MTVIRSIQAPQAVVMIRPHTFTPNPQTAADNSFQSSEQIKEAALIARQAYEEVGTAAATLERHGVKVHLFEDRGERDTPDSVFPNNWFSTHAGGHVAIYPMYSLNRRRERREDVIEMIKTEYQKQNIIK